MRDGQKPNPKEHDRINNDEKNACRVIPHTKAKSELFPPDIEVKVIAPNSRH
ncbi:MAG: hypothetical protein KF685_11485 [Acidobacteria bacterium]|nr:hypothetical protein [Acidobacteriota bacterium]